MSHQMPEVKRLAEECFELSDDALRKVKSLARAECANCLDGGRLCAAIDKPCFQLESTGLACAYFKECVLPLDEVLDARINPDARKLKPCAVCGGLIFATGNRQKYCNACSRKRLRQRKAEREREYRAEKKRERLQEYPKMLAS